MKQLILVAFSVFTVLSTTGVFAAERSAIDSDTGAGACFCRKNVLNNVPSAKLLDLNEAQDRFLTIITDDQRSVEEQAEQAISKLRYIWNDSLYILLMQEYKSLLKNIKFAGLKYDMQSGVCGDLFSSKDCGYEQIARYEDGTLYIDPLALGLRLSNTNVAALLVHTALYAVDKKLTNAKDSKFTRFVVGELFAADARDRNNDYINHVGMHFKEALSEI